MKKYILIVLVILALVIGAYAVANLFGVSETNLNNVEDTEVSEETGSELSHEAIPTEEDTFSGTDELQALASLGVPVECQVTLAEPDADMTVEGTYFVADGKIRGDFIQTAPGIDEPILASMIVTDSMVYTWSEIEGEVYGVKFDNSQSDAETDTMNEQQPISTEEEVQYTCTRWREIDNSIFEPPSDILFQDVSTLMEAGMEYGTVYEEGEF